MNKINLAREQQKKYQLPNKRNLSRNISKKKCVNNRKKIQNGQIDYNRINILSL